MTPDETVATLSELTRLSTTLIAGNPVVAWALVLAAIVLLIAALAGTKAILRRRFSHHVNTPELTWQQLVLELSERTTFVFIILFGIYAGSLLLELPENLQDVIFSAFVIALFLQGAYWADRVLSALITWRLVTEETRSSTIWNALSLIRFFVRVAIWSLALLLILDNLGFDVTALVAGLGIGGVAVALAAQSVLGDLFASLAIILDKPFEVGDFIIFDDQLGTVERIGIKTTRIRALSGEQLVCANADLLGSRIHNYKRMQERRIVFKVGVTYETPHDKLARIPGILQEIVENQEGTRFERAHFTEFGDFALVFEIVHWIQSADYIDYMDTQQAINLEIFRRFEQEGIAFAYPTQTVHVAGLQTALKPPSSSSSKQDAARRAGTGSRQPSPAGDSD